MAKYITIESEEGFLVNVRCELESLTESPLTIHEKIICELYSKVQKLSKMNKFKTGDSITDGVFNAILETEPELTADIIWLHNDTYVRNVNISNFSKINDKRTIIEGGCID